MSDVTTELAPITHRSPIVTPLVTTTCAPHQTLSPIRVGPLAREALPRDRPDGVVEAMVGVGDEAAVGEHAVLADLDQLERRHHHAEVQERAGADPDPRRAGSGDPHAGLEQRLRADLEPALAQRLEHVAVQRPADERLPAHELPMDPRAVPRQRVALVPAPLLHPQLERRASPRWRGSLGRRRAWRVAQSGADQSAVAAGLAGARRAASVAALADRGAVFAPIGPLRRRPSAAPLAAAGAFRTPLATSTRAGSSSARNGRCTTPPPRRPPPACRWRSRGRPRRRPRGRGR